MAAKPIQILRQRRGGVPQKVMTLYRERSKIRKRITEALNDGPKTVPEVAEMTGIPSHEVLWHTMGLKKYGLIKEGDERDGYYEYALQEKGK